MLVTVAPVKILRTSEDRFEDLPGYDFAPHYSVIEGIRIHHIDEGSGPVVLLMHGEPSWSYLYRKMVAPLVESGYRVVAPDLVGFGKSDKPASVDDHSYARHVSWMSAWLNRLDLTGVTLFAQDWGGLIGLRLVTGEPGRFARVAVANTGLPTGDHQMPEAFLSWQKFSREVPEFPVGSIVGRGTVGGLTQAELDAYEAPFPDESFKSGPRIMPSLVPCHPDDPEASANREGWKVLSRWEKPFLTLFSDSDPLTSGGERVFHKLVPGAADQSHRTIAGAGHFLQEDASEELSRTLIGWME